MARGKWTAVAVAGFTAGSALGAGFQLYTEGSAEALGLGGAVSGRDDLISLAWYNPAALAGAERPAVMAGMTFASLHVNYSGGGATASMYDDWRPIPHFYYIQPIDDSWTATLSINAPYGLITEWPAGWGPGGVGAQLATYSELQTLYLTPSVAWRPTERLAIAAGLNVVDAQAQLEGTGRIVKGSAMNYGGTCSAHLQLWEDWGFGLRYQSRVQLDISGSLNGVLPASAELELPSSVTVGMANSSLKNLTLGMDLIWTEWSTYDVLAIESPVVLPVAPKNWEDVISIRIGAEYALSDRWALRAGYVWDESPVPDTTRAPEMPGSDRQMVMLGAGWNNGRVGIDLAYSYLWAEDAEMGTALPIPGSFETTTHLVALSARYSF